MSETEEQKPEIPVKSSNEILSELFNSFDADPPLIIKKEKNHDSDNNDGTDNDDDDDDSDKTLVKKNKKSKKKHKHKDKKHKKKDKKRKRSSSSERSEIDLAEILIKQEKESNENKIKIEGTNLSYPLSNNIEIKSEKYQEDKSKETNKDDSNENSVDVDKQKEKKIKVKLKTTNLDLIKSNNKTEDGELSDSDMSEHKKKKRKHKSHEKSEKKHRSRSTDDRKLDKDDLRNKLRKGRHRRSKSRDDRSKDNHHSRYRSREHSRDKEKRDKSDGRNSRDNPFYRDEDNDRDYRWRKRYRSPDEHRRRDRSNSHDSSSHIDKKKLLEIARKNAIQMMKSGSLPGALTLGPQAQEKVIAAIKAGGKTIEELTEFCKALSKKEEQDGHSTNSDEHHRSDSDNDVPFHHPFQIKDRPTSITMNIKNSVPLPLKTTQERTSELRIQFPVSSGQLHRKTENEWVPVSPKKIEPAPVQSPPLPPPPPIPPTIVPPVKNFVTGGTLGTTNSAPPPVPAPLPVPEPTTQIAPESTQANVSTVDIGAIVSQRLSAMRKLQENPNDVQALAEMYKSNKEMQTWAESKQQPGQFTGTTGAQILSQAELSSGYQTWAKKDQLQTATPVSGGMGMHLLQKMGWKPGEGLGKEKTGTLEPLLLEVKLDKKGLVANEEQKKKKKQTQNWNPTSLQNKHPVSLLGEYASKKKLGAPQYNLCFECGPDHKKNFLFQVVLNGVEYKPNVASPTKKEAKAMAATVCLQHLGLFPPS